MRVKTAIERHDLLAFEKYVDVNSLVNSGVDVLISTAVNESLSEASDDPMQQLGVMIGGNIAANLKPQAVSMACGWLNEFVDKGTFTVDGEVMEINWLSDVHLQSTPEVRKESDLAYVTLRLAHAGSKTTLKIDLKMKQRDGYWQIIDIRNWSELSQEVKTLRVEWAPSAQVASKPEMSMTQPADKPQTRSAITQPAQEPRPEIVPTSSTSDISNQEIDRADKSASVSNSNGKGRDESKYGKEYDACVERAESVHDTNQFVLAEKDCQIDETVRQDARLNRLWKELLNSLGTSDLAAEKRVLVNEERSWIKEKEQKCVPEDEGFSSRLNAQSCLLDMTFERANQLEARLKAN